MDSKNSRNTGRCKQTVKKTCTQQIPHPHLLHNFYKLLLQRMEMKDLVLVVVLVINTVSIYWVNIAASGYTDNINFFLPELQKISREVLVIMGKFGCLLLFGMEILILLLAVAPPPGVEAWGKEGHYSTCKIAEPLLSKEASEAVRKLLPKYAEGDLASLCSWPDQMRFRFHWASPLHYINTPDNQCGYDYERDCHDEHGVKGVCLEGAIKNYTSQLETYGSRATGGKYNLTQALLFLSHFMGDVHEPLHVGFTSDEGGNTIQLHWYKRKCNLHHVWDSFIIEKAMKEYYDNDLEVMIEAIQKNISDSWSDEVTTWEKCNGRELACPGSYADESIILACKWAYKDAKENSVLEDDYFLSRLPILEKQLARGGVRLAATLNRIFSSKEGYTRESEL